MSEQAVGQPVVEKPLHVLVAEALGCKPEHRTHYRNGQKCSHPYWACTCADTIHNIPDIDGALHRGNSVEHYDTDWSATGPLIEKLWIKIESKSTNPEIRWSAWANETAFGGDWAGGPTPLEAVCKLIVELAKAGRLAV